MLATAGAGDRLLWAWSAGPLILLSLAPVKNAHYAVCAQVPWSIWAALELAHLGNTLRQRGWDGTRLRQITNCAFATLAVAYGVGFWLLGPWFDRRGVEWAFYESVGRQVPANMPLALLYDDWDRDAYDGALGALPHDLAVRLFYLGRPACWHATAVSLTAHGHAQEAMECSPNRWRDRGQHMAQAPASGPGQFEDRAVSQITPAFVVIGRDRDLPALAQLGRVEILARGPRLRRDRTYTVFQIMLKQPILDLPMPMARAGTADRTLNR
jgi:hypothetical protein